MHHLLCGCGNFLFKTPDPQGESIDVFCRRCKTRVTVKWTHIDGRLVVKITPERPEWRTPLANTGARVVRSSAK